MIGGTIHWMNTVYGCFGTVLLHLPYVLPPCVCGAITLLFFVVVLIFRYKDNTYDVALVQHF